MAHKLKILIAARFHQLGQLVGTVLVFRQVLIVICHPGMVYSGQTVRLCIAMAYLSKMSIRSRITDQRDAECC